MWKPWVFLAAGAYLIVSPWVLGMANQAAVLWSSLIVGAVVVILAVWELSTAKQRQTMSGSKKMEAHHQ